MPIICGTDFSPSAHAALELAGQLGRRLDEPVILFHSIQIPYGGGFDPGGPLIDWTAALKEAAESQLETTARELREASGVVVTTELSFGDPASQIVELAAAHQAEAVVVGTHGRKGVARVFLGSVAEHVVRHAARPVCVVPATAPAPARADLALPWRIAVVLDGGSGDAGVMSWATDLVERTPCETIVVRLVSPELEAARFGIEELWDGFEPTGPMIEAVDASLKRELSGSLILSGAPRCFVLASEGGLSRTARDLAALKPDVLVLGVLDPKRRTQPRAVRPETLLRALNLPAVCVPAAEELSARIPTVRSVLVAVDLSEPAPAAVRQAYGLLRNNGGRVELCSVYERGRDAFADGTLLPALTAEERRTHEQKLRALIPAGAGALGIVTNVSVLEGSSAAQTIAQAAARLGADIIAVAAHDRKGLSRALRGSVTEAVLRVSDTPTLVIHT